MRIPEPLPGQPALRVAAYAVCAEGGRLLLCRIGPGYPGSGRWMLPGGGLEFGEPPEKAVLRELDEETGLDGVVEGLLDVRSWLLPADVAPHGGPLQTLAVLYRVRIVGGTLRDEPAGSTDRAAWLDADAISAVRLARPAAHALGLIAGELGTA
jgi:8-oxo-dGTP diphosphatase